MEHKVDKTGANLEYSWQSLKHLEKRTSEQSPAKALILLEL
jgi:hypothetical protein